jgi:hypothetical protein
MLDPATLVQLVPQLLAATLAQRQLLPAQMRLV